MTATELSEILRLHALWLAEDSEGKRADLSGADLSGADLSGAYLSRANLRWANLTGANLTGANLRWAYLSRANLSEADLRGANLSEADLSEASLTRADPSGADLSEASLTGANLTGVNLSAANLTAANLTGANLTGANLTGANLNKVDVPVVVNLDRAILAAIEAPGGVLDMSTWHCCETIHCLAGWAIHLAGETGHALENEYGSSVAGALIYHASTGYVPDFFASTDRALADLKARAMAGTEEGGDP